MLQGIYLGRSIWISKEDHFGDLFPPPSKIGWNVDNDLTSRLLGRWMGRLDLKNRVATIYGLIDNIIIKASHKLIQKKSVQKAVSVLF